MTVLDRPVVIPPTRPALPQITGAGYAMPGPMDQAGLWQDFFADYRRDVEVLDRMVETLEFTGP